MVDLSIVFCMFTRPGKPPFLAPAPDPPFTSQHCEPRRSQLHLEPSRVATCGGEVELEVDGLAGPISEVVANGSSVVVSLGRKKWVDGGGNI